MKNQKIKISENFINAKIFLSALKKISKNNPDFLTDEENLQVFCTMQKLSTEINIYMEKNLIEV